MNGTGEPCLLLFNVIIELEFLDSADHFWLHQLWLLAHTYVTLRTMAMVSSARCLLRQLLILLLQAYDYYWFAYDSYCCRILVRGL